ncbi:MAG: sulfite exporter TauE/SafE family protein [Balneolales bacterium]|nr:sulfite exporter TauE/SafE family protein [Balneolales bacterium]
MLTFFVLLIIGLIGGVLAGLLGVGGGIIFTPVLFFLFEGKIDNPIPWVIGTSLFCTFFAAAGSVRKQIAMKNFFIKESLLVGFLGLTGTLIGKAVVTSGYYSVTEFSVFFSLILLFTAWKLFRRPAEMAKTTPLIPESAEKVLDHEPPLTLFFAFLTGASGGLIATLAGVGGGVVMVPLMVLLAGLTHRKAISISSAAIVCISFFGWMQFAFSKVEAGADQSISGISMGYVDFGTALPLVIGALLGSTLGVYLSSVADRSRLELLMAVLCLFVSLRMIYGIVF